MSPPLCERGDITSVHAVWGWRLFRKSPKISDELLFCLLIGCRRACDNGFQSVDQTSAECVCPHETLTKCLYDAEHHRWWTNIITELKQCVCWAYTCHPHLLVVDTPLQLESPQKFDGVAALF